MKPQPYTDPRRRLPPEALRFLSAIRWHWPEATRDVYVYRKPIPPPAREADIGNSNSATESKSP
jgi:hypothetical protein